MGNRMTKVKLLIWYPLFFYLLYCNGIKPMLIGTSKIMQRDNLLNLWVIRKCLISGFFSPNFQLNFFSFLNVTLFHCLTSLEWVNMFGALIIGNNFFPYKSHRKLMEMSQRWPCRDGDDAPNLYLTIALPNYNAGRGFQAYVLRVNNVFASLSKNVKNCMN